MMEFDPDLDWTVINDNGFNTHLGPILFHPAGDSWYGALLLEQRHINLGGVCHGAVYMALSDVTMGVAAHRVSEKRSATIDLQTHFLAAAKKGQHLLCQARLNRAVSGVLFMEADLWSGGRRCARASGIWKELNIQPKARP